MGILTAPRRARSACRAASLLRPVSALHGRPQKQPQRWEGCHPWLKQLETLYVQNSMCKHFSEYATGCDPSLTYQSSNAFTSFAAPMIHSNALHHSSIIADFAGCCLANRAYEIMRSTKMQELLGRSQHNCKTSLRISHYDGHLSALKVVVCSMLATGNVERTLHQQASLKGRATVPTRSLQKGRQH